MRFSKKIIIVIGIIVICSVGSVYGYNLLKNPVAEVFAYVPGDYFITNISDSKSLLKSSLTIEMTGKSQYKEIQENTFKVRDSIIHILRSKSYEEVKNPNIQELLKIEIKNKMKENFKDIQIQDIYFNEFVIQ